MIFYSISNNKSIKRDKEFNDKIGVSIDSEDVYDTVNSNAGSTGKKYKIKKLKTVKH